MRRECALLLALLTACSTPEHLQKQADELAAGANLQPVQLHAGEFTLLTYERIKDPMSPVRVYLEGDGNAWLTRSQISPDPTPLDPVALKLAVHDPAMNVVYLARPCQYISSPSCTPKYWSSAIFSDSIVSSVAQAMDRWHGHKLELVGYSGGGALALLVAARRGDIASVRTVAGNIDTDFFVELHHLSPFTESLNPAHDIARMAMIPQLHFVGEKDDVIPPTIAQHYQQRFSGPSCSAIITVPRLDHFSGWENQWSQLLARPLPCTAQ